MKVKEIVEKLLLTPIHKRTEIIRSLLPGQCEMTESSLGNLMVRISGESKNTILLDAHMDTIRFVVTGITSEGFVKVAPCGGVDSRILSGSEVTVWGREPLYGVFTIMPPHLKNSNSLTVLSVEEQAIDIGFSFEQATRLVSPGDVVTFRSDVVSLMNDKVSSSGLDNLAGVAVLISLAHKFVQIKPKHSLILQFSVFEETGHRFAGATTGTFAVLPSQAIVIDSSFASAPGLNYATPGEIGKGVMIGVSPMLSQKVSSLLVSLAKQQSIPFTQEVLGGSSGTNADGIVSVAGGIPTGLLSYPLLNMHTGVEVVSYKDLVSLENLLFLYCQEGGCNDE